MDIRFDGKTALVTGAGKGIGRSLTLKLVETGANVIAISRTLSDLESLKNEHPEKIQIICLDIGDWEATKLALENIGPVDFLVNNAAVLLVKEIGDIKKDEIDNLFDINMKAIINITQITANEMKARGNGGSIVNVSSVAGQYALPNYSIYGASKGALQALTNSMALEFGPHQIRVNAVNPTATRTPMAESVGFFEEGNAFAKAVLSRTPLRRIAEPEDVVYPIIFLLSDYASMITGATLPIDGGLGVCFI